MTYKVAQFLHTLITAFTIVSCILGIGYLFAECFTGFRQFTAHMEWNADLIKSWLLALIGFAAPIQVGVSEWCNHARIDHRRLQRTADLLRARIYEGIGSIDRHKIRITIFRATRWFNPLGFDGTIRFWWEWRRLIQVVRDSGHTVSSSSFWVNLHREAECEGVAARAFFRDGEVELRVSEAWSSTSKIARGKYARESLLPDHKAAALKTKGRHFIAQVIRRDGQRWGVIVVDCQDEDLLPNGIYDQLVSFFAFFEVVV